MQLHRYSMIIARIMVATVFLLNAIGVIDQTQAARELAECGAPANLVPYLMLVGRSVELLGGLALILGIFPRVAALALFVFLVPATLVGHAFWLAANTQVFVGQLINFLKNVAMMGGLLFMYSIPDQPGVMRGIHDLRKNKVAPSERHEAHV